MANVYVLKLENGKYYVGKSENVKRKALYWALYSENRRFREFIKKIGHDPDKILGEDTNIVCENDDVHTLQ